MHNMAAPLPAANTGHLATSQPQEHANLPKAPNLGLVADWLANAPSNEGYMWLQHFACTFNCIDTFTNCECNSRSKMVAPLLCSFCTCGMCLTYIMLTFVWAKPKSPRPPQLERLRPLDLATHFHTSGCVLDDLELDEWNFPITHVLQEQCLFDAVQDTINQACCKCKHTHLLAGQ